MDKEFVLAALRRQGRLLAADVQEKASKMSGTELNAERDFVPDFLSAKAKMNMLKRPLGFVCKSTAGRVVKLLQVYDSEIFTQEPEELAAQWGFVWSADPAHALPFVAMATSPYQSGDCCTFEGAVFKSKINNNIFSPADYPLGWEEVQE